MHTLSNFSSLGHKYLAGVADVATPAAFADVPTVINARNRAVNPVGGTLAVFMPLVNLLVTLAGKFIPLSQLQHEIRVEIRLSAGLNWGTLSGTGTLLNTGWMLNNVKLFITECRLSGDVERAMIDSLTNRTVYVPTFDVQTFTTSIQSGVGSFMYQVPIKASSVTSILVTMRETAGFRSETARALSRTKGNIKSYRWKIGSTYLPSTYVECDGSAAEGRMEVQRCFNQLSSPESHSFVDSSQFNFEGANGTAAAAGTC
jgi:hypothetical protein